MDEHKYKRRRLDPEFPTTNPSMADPLRSNDVSTPLSGSPPFTISPFSMSNDQFRRYAVSSRSYWDDQAALEYLVAPDSFAHDMHAVSPSRPSHLHLNPTSFSSTPTSQTSGIPAHSPDSNSTPTPTPRTTPSVSHYRPLPHDHYQLMPSPPIMDDRMRDLVCVTDSAQLISRSGASSAINDQYRLSQLAHVTANFHPLPPRRHSPPETTTSTIPQVMLTLSRATQESIDALAEHKQECPACQLEFEPDNFMAVISCCDTAMHATCLSAWVNSQTYNKSRTCMKCRRAIDARRALNSVVPPVSDKSWDEGADLNAPEAVRGDSRIEIPVSARPERPFHRRHARGSYGNYRGRFSSLQVPEMVPQETKQHLVQLHQKQMTDYEVLRRRVRTAYLENTRALEEDRVAHRTLAEARATAPDGSPAELHALYRKCEETKAASNKSNQDYRNIQGSLEDLHRTYEQRVSEIMGRVFETPGDGEASIPTSTEDSRSVPTTPSP